MSSIFGPESRAAMQAYSLSLKSKKEGCVFCKNKPLRERCFHVASKILNNSQESSPEKKYGELKEL